MTNNKPTNSNSNAKKRRPAQKITKGDLNRGVDTALHRHFKDDPVFILVDSALHFMIEGNPSESFEKLLKYNVKPILKALRARK